MRRVTSPATTGSASPPPSTGTRSPSAAQAGWLTSGRSQYRSPLADRAARAEAAGQTAVFAAWDGAVRGVLIVADTVKPTSAAAIARLRGMGLRPVLLTGDNERAARFVADAVGIDEVIAGVLPEGKAAAVKELQAAGRVVAVAGDGVNDAAALAQADLGLAMGTGTDAAIEAAALTLVRGDLSAVPDAIALSRRTLAVIKGNLFWAFAYNAAAIPLAALGFLSPLIAGAAMAFSSVFVVTNSLRLRRFHPTQPAPPAGGCRDCLGSEPAAPPGPGRPLTGMASRRAREVAGRRRTAARRSACLLTSLPWWLQARTAWRACPLSGPGAWTARTRGCLLAASGFTGCGRRERLQGEGGDRGLKAAGHNGGAQPAGGQDRQQQPGGGFGVGAGPGAAAGLGVPDQVGQVRGDRADGIAGRAGQSRLGGQRRRVGKQHAVRGPGMPGAVRPRALGKAVPRPRAARPGQHVGQQPGRRPGACGQLVERLPGLGGGTLDDGGEQRRLRAEVLEDHRLADPHPGSHVGDLRSPVAGLGEHGGRRAQDRLPPLGRRQPGPPGRPVVILFPCRHRPANLVTTKLIIN